ncbi:MAG: hypothetical protein K8I30_20590, partial [Anaerolineae bacterium]|nr:hypothetical protein [Anaerolineae bacterium]
MVNRVIVLLVVLAFIFSACQPQAAEQIAELPTLAVLPSLTPSSTFTATPTATFTVTPTPTSTPTATLTPTTTNTPTSTVTVTASTTPTNTLTFTPTFTNTPVATNTPTLTPTPNTPQIITFTTSVGSGAPNTTALLRWTTVADSARIDQLNQQGAVMQTFPIAPTGELSVVLPANAGRQVIFRLVALRGGQEVSQSLPITITCSVSWFFGDQFAPQAANCPTAVGAIATGAFQPFERGVMLYTNANGLNRTYALINQNNSYVSYGNGWDGNSQPWSLGDPPSGLHAP